MRLTLSEIRDNAITFAHEWEGVASERAEAQSFWTELFAVFGIRRRSVATFEEKVRNLKGKYDRIDVFYSGVMLGEHKSLGEDLSKAASQAFDYVQSLQRDGRDSEIPQYIVVSDFQTIVVYDLDSDDPAEPLAKFKTSKLHENIKHLGFLSGYTTRPVDPEDPINIEAVEVLGELHDALEEGGYTGHALERFLVRVLFCLFADDTAIFENEEFKALVKSSRTDGSDLGALLARFFNVLDLEKKNRPAKLPEELRDLPWVNGELFREDLGFADFDGAMRDALIECCKFNWSRISPAVFGSLFQSIMAGDEGKKKRRQIGAHYTSERDIMKVVRSLFLDDLKAELAAAGKDKKKLQAFQDKLASLRFLDPACGCGNFLVVTYRELRELELQALLALYPHRGTVSEIGAVGAQRVMDLTHVLKVDVDQMHGIEIEEWPARIAEVAMWLIDHQMNQKVGEAFGQPVRRLPLKKSARIHIGNALRTNWNEVLHAGQCSHVLGNPPFVGKKEQTAAQKADLREIWGDVSGSSELDYVSCWYRVALRYMSANRAVRAAFVSTNSITQGEQVGLMWPTLIEAGVIIHFAHRTFAWRSEARGPAHVHVVIIGFGLSDVSPKHLTDYDDPEHPARATAARINPYLIDFDNVIVQSVRNPRWGQPPLAFGNMPNDGGHLLLDDSERTALLDREPAAASLIRRIVGPKEFIYDLRRWCLWLAEVPPAQIRAMPAIMERGELVRAERLKSTRAETRKLAQQPLLFGEIRQPRSQYLAIPKTSSETRQYIPMAFLPPAIVTTTDIFMLADASRFEFGVLTSEMHMAWVRQVGGRMKSDYRYSSSLVYNNFPWPQAPTDKQKSLVEIAAQSVLDARAQFKGQTLADLYDPLAMPKPLRDAHRTLDRAVDKCYRAQPFASERARVEYLFGLYQRLDAPLTAPARISRRRVSKKKAS